MKFLKQLFNKVPSLTELGIFGVADDEGDLIRFCFYLNRAFGNVIIHKTQNLSEYYQSFKNRGGIYKQIDFRPDFRTVNTEIFNVFGAALVSDIDFIDKQYPTEVFGSTFSDAHIKVIKIKNKTCLNIYLKERWLFFLHPDFVDSDTFEQNEYELLLKEKVQFIFFHQVKKQSRCYLSIQEFNELVK